MQASFYKTEIYFSKKKYLKKLNIKKKFKKRTYSLRKLLFSYKKNWFGTTLEL